MNKVILLGRMVADPEVKAAGETNVCNFVFAVDRPKTAKATEQTADFPDCTAWGKTAEFLGKYAPKGTKLLLEGVLQTTLFTDKEDKKRKATTIRVINAEFAGPKVAAEETAGVANDANGDDDDCPF